METGHSLLLGAFIVCMIAIAVTVLTKYEKLDQWMPDRELSGDIDVNKCDIHVIDAKDIRRHGFHTPMLIKGLTNDWPAIHNWQRWQISSKFGERVVSSGSESAIVYGGGTAGTPITMKTMLERMRSKDISAQDSFTFDVSILKAIPELVDDFRVPEAFSDWDNPENEKNGLMWHMLSLGPGSTGLPFHLHGKTWIAVVHGYKHWFLYPPGASPPPPSAESVDELSSTGVSLQGVKHWFKSVYPLLLHLAKPPLVGVKQPLGHPGYRPMECTQSPGDVMFLPDGWSHMTLNLGETIGIGGQMALPAHDRLKQALEVLKSSPTNFEALKAAALGVAHSFMEEEQNFRAKFNYLSQSKPNKVPFWSIRKDSFVDIVGFKEDTWLMFYVQRKKLQENESKTILEMLNSLSKDFKGRLNIGVIDTSSDEATYKLHELDTHRAFSDANIVVAMYKGIQKNNADENYVIHNIFRRDTGTLEKIIGNREILMTSLDSLDSLHSIVAKVFADKNLVPGGSPGISARGRLLLQIAEVFTRKGISIEPLNPEIRGLLGEILGYQGRFQDMEESMNHAEKVFTTYSSNHPDHFSSTTLASIYHKLATTYLTQEMTKLALPLLNKSLSILPNYAPALFDIAVSYFMSNDRIQASKALKELEVHHPNHPQLSALRDTLNGISKPQPSKPSPKESRSRSKRV